MEETWTEIEWDSESAEQWTGGPFTVPAEAVGEGGWYELGPEGLQRISD